MKIVAPWVTVALLVGCAAGPPAVEPFPGVEPSPTCPNPRAGVVSSPFPRYPRSAIHDGRSGWVIAEFDVLPDGSTTNLRIVAASPPGLFEESAREAFSQWKYAPGAARVNCRADAQFNVK